jgi:hypothetical protein
LPRRLGCSSLTWANRPAGIVPAHLHTCVEPLPIDPYA